MDILAVGSFLRDWSPLFVIRAWKAQRQAGPPAIAGR